MRNLKINTLAIVVITILGQVIPMGWYTLFNQKWMDLNELTAEAAANVGPKTYISSIIASAIIATMMALLFRRMRVESLQDGLVTGTGIGFVFTFLPTMINNLFSFRPYELSWIDGGCNIVIYAIAGAILGGWRKYA